MGFSANCHHNLPCWYSKALCLYYIVFTEESGADSDAGQVHRNNWEIISQNKTLFFFYFVDTVSITEFVIFTAYSPW